MKHRLIPTWLVLAIAMVVVGIVVYLCQPASRIAVTNSGTNVIEIRTDGLDEKTLLGQNGTGYFDTDSRIHIGDALISVGRRLEVINTGSGVIEVAYHETSGSEQTTTLGEGGSGYFSKVTPISIGEVNIRIGSAQ